MREHEPRPGMERCWLVRRDAGGGVAGGVAALPEAEAAAGPLVRVEAAGFNYKDALALAGHPGVARMLPLVPGIDLAGELLEPAAGLPGGAAIVATGHGLGETRHGGFATLARPPEAAIIPRPAGLSAAAAMSLGTAGLTALLAVDRLEQAARSPHLPADAEWLVTGASGGVGMIAVATLAGRGRRVVAASRKRSAAATLLALGAAEVVEPDAIRGDAAKSLVRGRWAAVIDTVGGQILADALKAVLPGGSVAAIGMAAGADLATTVHPFILRGVTLFGIDAASLPSPAERAALWPRLAALWSILGDRLPVTQLCLEEAGDWGRCMLAGGSAGRAIVVPAARLHVRHRINLAAAWEPADGDERAGARWRRRFGRPTGLEPGDAVRLAFAAAVPGGRAEVALNGVSLPPLEPGRPWNCRVTHLMADRNELVVSLGGHAADATAHVGLDSPTAAIGPLTLEVVALALAP